jgi:hypothetical protein
MAPAHVRHLRPVTLGDLLVLFAATACLLDAFSTWVALTSGSFSEHTPATASFIAWWGLAGGLSISVLLRVAVFASLAVAMQRLPKFSLPLFAIGFAAAMLTWLIVLANAAALAAN